MEPQLIWDGQLWNWKIRGEKIYRINRIGNSRYVQVYTNQCKHNLYYVFVGFVVAVVLLCVHTEIMGFYLASS